MQCDVIVVGGGHAGCEAAAAAARMGARTILVTMRADRIGAMSCNPAIGGIGKGHLVREIDVFDGLIARAADYAAIHYRMLNASKGAAVRGPRVQADRSRFRTAIQTRLGGQARLKIVEAESDGIVLATGGAVAGVRLRDGTMLSARAIVVAAGTFLNGKLHFGMESVEGGRIGEPASTGLSTLLRERGVPMGRLKTGTPPRLDGRTIDWARVGRQASDGETWTMSALGDGRQASQVACGITRTNGETHAVIREAMDRSPLYTGVIEGIGPRYCPSIEDKIVKFGDRDGHQIFLEPEGLDDPAVYPNGISTSLPLGDQARFIATISGLEQAVIVQPGYAVEYDHIDPRALDHDLQVRDLPGLFCAGQINGTTGYEEAAAQGLVAGLAAAAQALDREGVRFDRRNSYIGVLIDDLVLQGVTEPYRMLTSRAEYRLHLRADNASTRLGAAAIASGAISVERRDAIERRATLHARLSGRGGSGREMPAGEAEAVADEVAADRLYAPYLVRQHAEAERVVRDTYVLLDRIETYRGVAGLSNEMVERLDRAKPANLGDAMRIRGITPSAVSAILIAARKAAA